MHKMIIMMGLMGLMGCSGVSVKTVSKDGITTYTNDNRCVVQSSATVLGLDIQVFDLLATGNSSPQKIRLGYVTSQQQVTPINTSAELTKEYDLDSDRYTVKMTVDTGRKE